MERCRDEPDIEPMNNKLIIKYASANALWAALYIILVGVVLSQASSIFGNEPSILIPVAMLLLFVISATITAGLILGRPLLWYMDGQKKEALKLLGFTMIVLFIVTIFVLLALYFTK